MTADIEELIEAMKKGTVLYDAYNELLQDAEELFLAYDTKANGSAINFLNGKFFRLKQSIEKVKGIKS